MILVRKDERNWSNAGIPGVQTCQTWEGKDGGGGYFAKFQAGAGFPKHAHHGMWEQIIVLSGALRFNHDEMRAGDVLQVQGIEEHEVLALEDSVVFVAHHKNDKNAE
ncbi:cupin domain-containing protein [Janthinobacterium fluminis]|uniref:Cupin domain-containing protein n=1 Tax=Janthinobacterium fluminis TaxID=2987524 RepID=A0ABT5K6B3_9BURK|nr:cupin domain-containing protein [Janthinobacterium fluminis]MDC8760546.1 cupin domain-containing protein [Janthinobacterium fluminis]